MALSPKNVIPRHLIRRVRDAIWVWHLYNSVSPIRPRVGFDGRGLATNAPPEFQVRPKPSFATNNVTNLSHRTKFRAENEVPRCSPIIQWAQGVTIMIPQERVLIFIYHYRSLDCRMTKVTQTLAYSSSSFFHVASAAGFRAQKDRPRNKFWIRFFLART